MPCTRAFIDTHVRLCLHACNTAQSAQIQRTRQLVCCPAEHQRSSAGWGLGLGLGLCCTQAGVFLAPGRSDAGVMRKGDAGFALRGSGHYLRCASTA